MFVFDDIRESVAELFKSENKVFISETVQYFMGTFQDDQSRDRKYQDLYEQIDEDLREEFIKLRPRAAEDMIYLQLRQKYILQKTEGLEEMHELIKPLNNFHTVQLDILIIEILQTQLKNMDRVNNEFIQYQNVLDQLVEKNATMNCSWFLLLFSQEYLTYFQSQQGQNKGMKAALKWEELKEIEKKDLEHPSFKIYLLKQSLASLTNYLYKSKLHIHVSFPEFILPIESQLNTFQKQLSGK